MPERMVAILGAVPFGSEITLEEMEKLIEIYRLSGRRFRLVPDAERGTVSMMRGGDDKEERLAYWCDVSRK